jgi:hypothetical protein
MQIWVHHLTTPSWPWQPALLACLPRVLYLKLIVMVALFILAVSLKWLLIIIMTTIRYVSWFSCWLLRFEVLITVNIKIVVFLDVMPCSFVNRYQHFGETCCHQDRAKEWIWKQQVPPEHWYIHHATHCQIPEYHDLNCCFFFFSFRADISTVLLMFQNWQDQGIVKQRKGPFFPKVKYEFFLRFWQQMWSFGHSVQLLCNTLIFCLKSVNLHTY